MIAPGSSSIHVRDREAQIAELLAMGYSHKRIANRLGIKTASVSVYIHNLAARIPDDAPGNVKIPPTMKVTLWWTQIHAAEGE